MKGKFWRKALAAAMALLIVSGGVPIQPLSQVFDRTAITAEAAQEQIVTYTLERELVNARNIYYLVGTDDTRNMAYDGGGKSPTRITLEMGDDVTVDVYLGGATINCGYTQNQEIADLIGFTNYFIVATNHMSSRLQAKHTRLRTFRLMDVTRITTKKPKQALKLTETKKLLRCNGQAAQVVQEMVRRANSL